MRRFFSLICIFFISLALNSKILADELANLELPTGGEVVSGDISIQKEAGKLIINQNSSKGIIEWQKFNVGADASVYFNHKNNTDSILNQIVGGSKSIILGNIFSNGKLFVNNPNGITVGANASINAHSFIGSAMKIANQDFLNHNYHYKQDRESLIDQNGNIDAQYVALMATDVTNSGTINSKNGSVNLAASDDMVLKISSDNSLQIKVKPSKLKATVSNKGIVIAENGVVTIKADMAQDAIAATIKAPENQAKGLVSKNGVIKLVSNSGTIKAKKVTLDAGQRGAVENTGKIDTSSATSKGGSVELIGKEVIIKSGSEIKSNGKKQGGNIYVGNPTLLNSVTDNTFVTLENNTILDVSSLEDSAGVVKIRTGKSSNGSMTSVNGVILARTGSSRRQGLANVAVTGYDVNLNEIYIDVSSTSDSGGNIDIEATNDVVGAKISLISNGKNEGGDINVVSLFGDVNLQQSIVQTNASLGRGGTVNINAKQNIFLIDSNLYARGSPEGGNVTILSSANDVNLKSTVVQTNGSTGRGGTVEIAGYNYTIVQKSSIFSKGLIKGGKIYIGNNFFEKSIPFSKYTYIDTYSTLDTTSFKIGGFIETSGQALDLWSTINVGFGGLWLIDPYDVTIASSGASGSSYSSSFTPSQNTTILASSIISSLNSGTSVSITTGSSSSNTLTVNAAISKTSGSSSTLTLTGGFIDINADISSSSNALNLTLNAATMDIASNLSLNGGDLRINNSSNVTFSGTFSGSGNLYQLGAGQLTLSGNNSYSGTTHIYGKYDLYSQNSLGSGQLLFYNGSSLLASSGGAAKTISNNINLVSGSTTIDISFGTSSDFTLSGTISGSGKIVLTGDVNSRWVNLSGNNTFSGGIDINSSSAPSLKPIIRISNNSALGSGTITSYGTTNYSNIVFMGNYSVSNAFVTNSSSTYLNFDTQGYTATLSGVLSGAGTVSKAGSGTLNLSGASNNLTGDLVISAGELATSGSGRLASTYAGDISNSGTLHYGSSAATTSSGVISGSGIVKVSAGTVTLSGTNTYSGSTTITNGVISISSSANLGATPGSADADNIIFNGGTLTTTATFTLGTNKGITMTGTGTINTNTGTLSYGGVTTGSGNLTKSGSGTLILSGANGHTGDVIISLGKITLGVNSAISSLSDLVVNGTLDLNGYDLTVASLSGAGSIVNSGVSSYSVVTDNLILYLDASNSDSAQSSSISTWYDLSGSGNHATFHNGSATVTDGKVIFDGQNNSYFTIPSTDTDDFTSGFTIIAGFEFDSNRNWERIIDFGNAANSSNILFARSSTSNDLSIWCESSGCGSNLTSSGGISNGSYKYYSATMDGSNHKIYVDTTLLASNNNTSLPSNTTRNTNYIGRSHWGYGDPNLKGEMGALLIYNGALTSSQLTQTINALNDVSSGTTSTLTVSGSSSNNYTGTIDGSINLTKTGSGTLTLSGNNTYTGQTNINAGIISITHNNALGSADGATIVADGASLSISNDITSAENITINGTGISSNGAIRNTADDNTLTGLITLGANSEIQIDTGSSLTLNPTSGNAITGTYNLTIESVGTSTISDPIATSTGNITKTGAGTLTLSGTNTYSGDTTISAGTIKLTGSVNTANRLKYCK
jgi:filamentous hemagglutinin family protein